MKWKVLWRKKDWLPKEEGDVIREYKAMHEENFLSSWSREDGREKEERTVEMSNENEEEKGEKRRREEEKEENDPCGVSDCDFGTWTSVPVVTDVPVSPGQRVHSSPGYCRLTPVATAMMQSGRAHMIEIMTDSLAKKQDIGAPYLSACRVT